MKRYPVSSLGWHQYYVRRFNKTLHPDAEYLAVLYLFFALRDEDAQVMRLADYYVPY